MNYKLIISILTTLSCTLIGLIWMLSVINSELVEQLEFRDTLIKSNQNLDSLTCEHNQKYVETINHYITNECAIILDDKKISLSEFIDIYANEIQKNSNYMDSLRFFKRQSLQFANLYRSTFPKLDSLNLLKIQIKNVSKRYDINITTTLKDSVRYTTIESPKIDSALILLKYFRNKLSYDPIKKVWMVIRE
jgi:hypothetical protein